jgi:two-component system sensor histidine kinase AgrC
MQENQSMKPLVAWLRQWMFRKPQGLNIKKTVWTLYAVNIAQIAALVLMLILILLRDVDVPDWALVFVSLTMLVSNMIMTRSSRTNERYRQQVTEMAQLIGVQDDLNRQMRMQRHDFINHLQVIYALLQMNESQQAQEYMDQVYSDLQRVGTLLRTQSSAVNGLLAAKAVQAEKRGIRMAFDIATPLGAPPLEDWELCRVLSNLLDNAMDACETTAGAMVELKLWEDIKGLHFRVANNGPEVPLEIREEIFRPGVTTKGDRGTGMGLYIVKSIVEGSHGEVTLASDEKRTAFSGYIPPHPQAAKHGDI